MITDEEIALKVFECRLCRESLSKEHLIHIGTVGYNNWKWCCLKCAPEYENVITTQQALCGLQGHDWPRNWKVECVCKCCGKIAVFGTGHYSSKYAEKYHGT